MKLASLGLDVGTSFEHVFDLGNDWRHRFDVQTLDVDPEEESGDVPDAPVPIWGWGWLPDQYSRIGEDGQLLSARHEHQRVRGGIASLRHAYLASGKRVPR